MEFYLYSLSTNFLLLFLDAMTDFRDDNNDPKGNKK
jgi:hypothetical protein